MLDDMGSTSCGEHRRCSMRQPENVPRKLIEELAETTPWPGALTAGEYRHNAQLRPWLERAVGLGLGVFDLVIVDGAHKSRGQDSGLNRLLTEVVLICRCPPPGNDRNSVESMPHNGRKCWDASGLMLHREQQQLQPFRVIKS